MLAFSALRNSLLISYLQSTRTFCLGHGRTPLYYNFCAVLHALQRPTRLSDDDTDLEPDGLMTRLLHRSSCQSFWETIYVEWARDSDRTTATPLLRQPWCMMVRTFRKLWNLKLEDDLLATCTVTTTPSHRHHPGCCFSAGFPEECQWGPSQVIYFLLLILSLAYVTQIYW